MKPGVPAWSVVVVAFRGPHHVLAITRAFNTRDPGLPGGDSEPQDATPADTARRELLEETGMTATELRCMDQWTGERGQPVFAFFAPKIRGARLRASPEGKPFWTSPKRLMIKTATYRETAARLFAKLGRMNG